MTQYQPGPPPALNPPQPPKKKRLGVGAIIAIVAAALFVSLIGGCAAILGIVASTSPDVSASPTSAAPSEPAAPPASTPPSTAPSASSAATTAPTTAPTTAAATVAIAVSCEDLLGAAGTNGPLTELLAFITAQAKDPAATVTEVRAAKANNDAIIKIGTTAMEPLKTGIRIMTTDTGPWLDQSLKGGTQDLNTDNFVLGGGEVTKACGATDDDEPSAAPETTEAAPPADPYDKLSVAEQNAVDSARSYLDNSSFSRAGLLDQLTSEYGEDYSKKLGNTAVDFVEKQDNVSWNKEAEEAAKSYLDNSSFSCNSLIDQLASAYGDKFTQSQARHGAKSTGIC